MHTISANVLQGGRNLRHSAQLTPTLSTGKPFSVNFLIDGLPLIMALQMKTEEKMDMKVSMHTKVSMCCHIQKQNSMSFDEVKEDFQQFYSLLNINEIQWVFSNFNFDCHTSRKFSGFYWP